MNVSSKVSEYSGAPRLAPYLPVAVVLALLSFVGVYLFGIFSALIGVLALVFLCVTVAKPDLATLAVVFIMYSNAAAIAVHSSPGLTPIALGVFLLLFIPAINFVVFRREGLRINTVLQLMFVYLAIMIASALFSRTPGESFKTIAKYVFEGMIFYFLILNSVRTPQVLRKVMWVLLLVGSTLGALSWIQDVTKTYENDYAGFASTNLIMPDKSNQEGDRLDTGVTEHGKVVRQFRALGPVSDPNFYAQDLVAVLPFGLVLAFADRSKRVRFCAAAACILVMAGIVLTFSRGAGLAVLVLGVCLFLLRYFSLRYAFVFAAGLMVVVLSTPFYLNRLLTVTGISSKNGVEEDESILERSGIIRTGLHVFVEHPLVGVGIGQATEYIEFRGVGYSAGTRGMAPHNTYLELLMETGFLGFACFMAIAYITVRNLLRASRYWIKRRPEYAHTCVAFMLAVVGFLTASLFLHLAYPRYYWLLMGLAGAAAAVFNPEEAEKNLAAIPSPPAARSLS